MVKGDLVRYVQNYHAKGYSLSTLRSFLIKQGYGIKDVEAAINEAYTPSHHSHKLYYIIGGVAILVILVALGFLIPQFFEEEMAVSLAASPQKSVINERETLNAIVDISGVSTTTTATLSYEVKNAGVVVDSGSKTVDAAQSSFPLSTTPTEPGVYTFITMLTFEGTSHQSTFTFQVESTCGNNRCETYETRQSCVEDCVVEKQESVCGDDVCSANEQCPADCDVGTCGNDICDADESSLTCEADCPAPVCGDNICDAGEQCTEDCEKTGGVNDLTRYELTQYVPEQTQEKGAGEVAKDCNTIADVQLRDVCFFELTKASQDKFYCGLVEVQPKRDDCFITYAFNTNDYTVCGDIEDRYKKQTCEGLQQSYELQQQYQ